MRRWRGMVRGKGEEWMRAEGTRLFHGCKPVESRTNAYLIVGCGAAMS
ncbi:MAG: hypothetical protein K2L14_09435 [Duncaniella sp.]|nr:hypothetical protein [Duncaniella sp.]